MFLFYWKQRSTTLSPLWQFYCDLSDISRSVTLWNGALGLQRSASNRFILGSTSSPSARPCSALTTWGGRVEVMQLVPDDEELCVWVQTAPSAENIRSHRLDLIVHKSAGYRLFFCLIGTIFSFLSCRMRSIVHERLVSVHVGLYKTFIRHF